jgi:hypothetical protein
MKNILGCINSLVRTRGEHIKYSKPFLLKEGFAQSVKLPKDRLMSTEVDLLERYDSKGNSARKIGLGAVAGLLLGGTIISCIERDYKGEVRNIAERLDFVENKIKDKNVVIFVGRSRAGKSSLIGQLMGYEAEAVNESGQIRLRNKSDSKDPPKLREGGHGGDSKDLNLPNAFDSSGIIEKN